MKKVHLRSLICILALGLTACAAPAPTDPALTRKTPTATKASAAPAVADPFTDQGHGHAVTEEPGVTYAAAIDNQAIFIHGRHAAWRIGNAVAITLDFHHETFSSAVLRFDDVEPGFKKEELTTGGLQLSGPSGKTWGLTIASDREAFLKGLTLSATTDTIAGSFKGEVRPLFGGAEGRFPIQIEFETPFPTTRTVDGGG